MYILDLPDELLVKIYLHLFEDPKDIASLASSCKRLSFVLNRHLIYTDQWIRSRPYTFNLELDLESYMPDLCRDHSACTEQFARLKTKCELQSTALEKQLFDCYYHRMYCMIMSKYQKYSSVKFREARLSDRGCFRAFDEASRTLGIQPESIKFRIDAIVELELYECEITMDWLNTALNAFDNIKYLTLHNVSFTDSSILVEPKYYASKSLISLKITGDRTFRMNDMIFLYFFENFPSTELDISATRIEHHERIIQRFYGFYDTNSIESILAQPCEYIIIFPVIFFYLKKYRAVLRHFIASETNITVSSLKKILLDKDLENLKITIKDCPLITQAERARLVEQMPPQDMQRVTF